MAAITGGITAQQLKALTTHDSLTALLPNYETLRHRTIWQQRDGKGQVVELQPDLLAAALLPRLLKRDDDSPGEWLYAALDVSDDIAKASSRLSRLMHDTTRVLGLLWPLQALNEAVADDLSRCRHLNQGLSRNYLESPLLPLALHVTQTLLDDATGKPLEQAHLFNNLSIYLAKSGDRPGGLKAIQRAVMIYEKLAEQSFAAHAPDLANSFNNLSLRLAESGDRPEALKAIQRAVKIYKQLEKENHTAYAPNLAMSLNNLSLRLAESNNQVNGLETIQQAVMIYEELVEKNYANYAPDLANSLNTLSDLLTKNERQTEALKKIKQAVEIREKLAAENAAAHAPDLAGSLAILANLLAKYGEMNDVIATVERAIELITPFAINGTTYSDWLAMMKNDLARYQAASSLD